MSETNGQQAQFNGWARVELMGHQSHIGYVRTEVYGTAVLFRIDTPELQEREYTLEEPAYVGSRWTPAGTKVKREGTPGISVLAGAMSIYRIVPCSEAAALRAIEQSVRSELKVIELPAEKQLAVTWPDGAKDAPGDEDDESGEGDEPEEQEGEVTP